jgi:CDP-diglyceride synthetase
MRILKTVSGAAGLITTLVFGHVIHHLSAHAGPENTRSPVFWMGIAAAVIVAVFSLVGSYLLLRGNR